MSKFRSTKPVIAANRTLMLALFPTLLIFAAQAAPAQTETVIHFFTQSPDGAFPAYVTPVIDNGNLYGTTLNGGGAGVGTVFQVARSGRRETVLHHFFPSGDGEYPYAGVILDKNGNLYGTTLKGGAYGGGTVFEVTPSKTETVLYSFGANAIDGTNPQSALVLDNNGNLYGTTLEGGAYGGGTVFEVTPSGTETVLYSFGANGTDGTNPQSALLLDKKGNLYGTTLNGGAFGGGTVFEVTASGTETVLYSFNPNGTDGYQPCSTLVSDKQKNLYGTTYYGGAFGGGTVFVVTPSRTETILHNFNPNGLDGYYPEAGLVMDKTGNLYGTTTSGGIYGSGAVFELAPSGMETVLYSFSGGTDGNDPQGGLLLKNGNLYGTTTYGGAWGFGTLYKVTP